MWDTIKKIRQVHGIRSFWKGSLFATSQIVVFNVVVEKIGSISGNPYLTALVNVLGVK